MPNTPPSSALIDAITIIILCMADDIIIAIYAKGASFCHVDKIKQLIHDIADITEGYHRWNGAAPIFKASLIVKTTWAMRFNVLWKFINILDINSNLDPSAWFRKYFTEASVSWKLLDEHMIGIKHNRFNSIAIHINNQFVLEIANIVLVSNRV